MKTGYKTGGLIIVLLLLRFSAFAGEGMWLPQLLQVLNESDMKKQGLKINAEDIYSISKGSLKDAIVSFGGFCTGEIISNKGLILTNHHCGFNSIQNHSTLQHNYIRDGFWAKSHGEELRNPGLYATFIVRIDDVTTEALKNTQGLNDKERQSAIDKNIAALKKNVLVERFQDVLVKPFFEGNKYYLFVTETYNDVRLVGAPPASIGNFGKDTDNWMWPRHTGDFSLFRIYAGKDNKPANYSPDNVPYVPKRSLNISLDGVNEDDFTMVFGFPGTTKEYLYSAAVKQVMNVVDPTKISVRAKALSIMDGFMRSDEQIKIQYASKYAKMENYYKKWQGEVLGLRKTNAVAKKKAYETEFQKRVLANEEWTTTYGSLLGDLETAYAAIEPFATARDYHTEIISKIELFNAGVQLKSMADAYANNGSTGYNAAREKSKEILDELYDEYSEAVDMKLFEALLEMYAKEMKPSHVAPELKKLLAQFNNDLSKAAEYVYSNSILDDSIKIQKLLASSPEDVMKSIKEDMGYQLYTGLQKTYKEMVSVKLNEIQNTIDKLQRTYMQAQMEVFPEKKFYPDANSTLRLTYGQAKGYTPRDGAVYCMYTYLDGVMEKYVPGDYEFDVPARLIELYNQKDYGQYGMDGKQPVCFIATNHTTGGNSGSPALDAYGNLVGLNFDRVWEGTMSDINYDADICRNIMVDIRYVAFIIDKFAGAQNIVDELNFVHPKSKRRNRN